MSKEISNVLCIECGEIYKSDEIEQLHKIATEKANIHDKKIEHHYVTEKDSLLMMKYMINRLNELETIQQDSRKEIEVLWCMINEDRNVIKSIKDQQDISILECDVQLLKCETELNNNIGGNCLLFRVKNIIYMEILIDKKIITTERLPYAKIRINLPMWLIYSANFNVKLCRHYLNNENEINNIEYQQMGNVLELKLNGLKGSSFWKIYEEEKRVLKINGNLMVQPISIGNGKYYIYNTKHKTFISFTPDGKIHYKKSFDKQDLIEIELCKNGVLLKMENNFINSDDTSDSIIISKEKREYFKVCTVEPTTDVVEILSQNGKLVKYDGEKLKLVGNSDLETTFLVVQFLECPK